MWPLASLAATRVATRVAESCRANWSAFARIIFPSAGTTAGPSGSGQHALIAHSPAAGAVEGTAFA